MKPVRSVLGFILLAVELESQHHGWQRAHVERSVANIPVGPHPEVEPLPHELELHNQSLQATRGCACLFVVAQVPRAPEFCVRHLGHENICTIPFRAGRTMCILLHDAVASRYQFSAAVEHAVV